MAWSEAGRKVTEADAANAVPDDAYTHRFGDDRYKASANGYLVPYYPISTENESAIRERISYDLTQRFFRYSEIGINIERSRTCIEEMKKDFSDALDRATESGLQKDQSFARKQGALLVGACVHRIAQLTEAIIQQKYSETFFNNALESIDRPSESYDEENKRFITLLEQLRRNDLSPQERDDLCNDLLMQKEVTSHAASLRMLDTRIVRERTDPPFEEQFKDLIHFLGADPLGNDAVSCVKRRGGYKDVDGVVEEIISELGKITRIPLATIDAGRMEKIAIAMERVEQVTADMQTLLRSMAQHHNPEFYRLPGHHSHSVIPDIAKAIDALSTASRRRVGIKTRDEGEYEKSEGEFSAVRSNLISMLDKLDERIKRITERTGEHYPTRLDPRHHVFQLVRGADLITDMVSLRLERAKSSETYAGKIESLSKGLSQRSQIAIA